MPDEWHIRTSETWSPRSSNRLLAACIRELFDPDAPHPVDEEIHELAGRCGNCGQPHRRVINGIAYVLPMNCGLAILCEKCAWRSAFNNALRDAARTMLAHGRNPDLQFAMLTLTVPEMGDLEEQYQLIQRSRTRLRRMTRCGAKVLGGMTWWLHIDRGLGGGWRAHLHALVGTTADVRDIRKPLARRWLDLTLPDASRMQRRRASWSQHVAHVTAQQRAYSRPRDLILELGRDAYAISLYGGRPNTLSVSDRLAAYGYLNGLKLRGVSGVFLGHPEQDLHAIIAEVGIDALKVPPYPLVEIVTDDPSTDVCHQDVAGELRETDYPVRSRRS